MEQEKEAVYLINDNKYLHLRKNGVGVGFATYKRMNGELLESGQVSEMNLPQKRPFCGPELVYVCTLRCAVQSHSAGKCADSRKYPEYRHRSAAHLEA